MSHFLAAGEKEARFPGFRIGYWKRGHLVWCTVLIFNNNEDVDYDWRRDAMHLRGDFFESAVEVANKGLKECRAWFKFMEALCGVYNKNDNQGG